MIGWGRDGLNSVQYFFAELLLDVLVFLLADADEDSMQHLHSLFSVTCIDEKCHDGFVEALRDQMDVDFGKFQRLRRSRSLSILSHVVSETVDHRQIFEFAQRPVAGYGVRLLEMGAEFSEHSFRAVTLEKRVGNRAFARSRVLDP